MALTALGLFGAGAGVAGVNSALGVGQSFLSDWFGDSNREDQSALDWQNYQKKSALDWQYYKTNYAPLNQQLQQEMFDYTSAGNYRNSLRYIGDSLTEQKQALAKNGYNPILAINGGAAVHAGNVTGSVGAGVSPHSSSGVATSGGSVPVEGGKLSLGDMLGVLSTAKSLDKMDADIRRVNAETDKIIADTEKPGAVGQAERSLESIARQIGEQANSAWTSAIQFLKDYFNPPKAMEYNPHVGPNWEYDRKSHRSIYVPDN